MKTRTRLVALFLALIMVMSCAPISVFATDTTTLEYNSELYDENNAVNSYKQYEAFWNDPTYVKADVKYTVYFDTENATATRDVVFYVINWNGERIGTDTDTAIVTDLIKAPASEESGNRWAVVVVDFGGNPLAKAPNIELSLAFLRAELSGKKSITVWQDDSHTTTTTVPVHKNHVYVLPTGYRVARDIPYYETDYHASLGTRNYVMDGWNSHIAGNRTIYYAYHTGDGNCSFNHTANTGVECIAGAPQEIGDEVVAYKAGQLAPKVSRPADCRKKDGSPLDYVCRLDIIYPSGEDVEATPVMVQAATASPRMSNVGTYTLSDYDGDGEDSLCLRTMLVGMEFSGYTVAVYDYAYSPLARDDHYGYIDPYGTHDQNGAKTGRAAIRCIRYFAEKYGYDDSKIGVAGISKGTPTTAVLSTVNNKHVEENSYFTYDIDGSGNKVNTQNTWFEGDINDEGVVTQAQTSVVQPYLTYEAGYNGNKINGADINYDSTKTGEISSEVSAVYCAAGDGINWVYNGNSTIKLGATNPNTGEETQHVPMVLSAGYYDPHGVWNRWSNITNHFTNYADNPFLAISMEDMGHDYPAEHDPIRDYDRYDAYMQFFHSILNPEYYTPQVAWITPVDGAIDVSVESPIQVQLVKPATTLNAFESAVTVKDNYGNSVAGTWTTNKANSSGLYTFVPENGYTGGTKYTVTVDSPVVSEKTSKSFTVEEAGILRPVADTYVSATNKNAIYGTEKTLYIDNQRTYLATFKTSDFEGANKAFLNLPVTGENSQTLSVYLLDGFEIDESATCYNNTPTLGEDKLLGTYLVSDGDSQLDLLGIITKVKEEYFTLAISGSAHYYEENFESYNGTTIVAHSSSNTSANAPGADDCYSEHYVWRTAGGTSNLSVGKESNNKVAYVTSNATWNRIKWYNTFVSDKAYLDSSDIGKTFDLSFRLKVVPASGATSTRLRYALDTSVGTKTTYNVIPTENTWTPVTNNFDITEDVVKSDGVDTKIGILSFTLDGTVGNTYYFDDIIVREQAPTELVSREDTSAVTAYITTETIDEMGIIADTYVSKGDPDTSFGNDDKLLLNGGSNENIIFVTYSAKLVKDGSDIQFTIPTNDNVSVNTEMYLLDGYYVDEDRLTYNSMPNLTSAVFLGKYTLNGGINTIEIENAVEQINSDYFTVVFKSTDNYETVYFNDFEDYKVGTDINVYNHNVADTATDANGKAYTHYYAHVADSTRLARAGGSLTSIGNVLTDPNGSGNQTVDVYMSTDTAATYNGRIKLYNSISDGILTADSPIVGQTLRFTAKIKAGNQTTADNARTAFASVMLSVGGDPVTDTNGNAVKSNVITVSDKWQTVTVYYTVRAEDIKFSTTTGGNPVWAYPSFTIDFNNKYASNVFLIDNIEVVIVNSDGTLRNVEIASSEGADSLSDTISIKARKAKAPIADTYISATNKTGIFGLEKTLYADSQRTYLVSFKTADFDKRGKTYLSLPLSGKNSQTLSAYLLDGFKVNEQETNYNNTPALTADMLIGTYEVSEGSCKIDLSNSLTKVENDYFTIAVKGSAHYYEENFESYNGTTIVAHSSSNTSANAPGADDCYSEHYVWRTAGGTSNLSVGKESNNKVAYVTSNATWNRIKWYNTFVSDKAYLDSSDIGKTFDLSFKLKVVPASGATSTRLRYALDTSVGTKTTYNVIPTANTWAPVTHSFDITEDVVKSNGADTKIGILSFTLDGTVGNTYYFDDIIVSEVAPKAIASLESDGQTATIITTNDIIADTYVSEVNPDTCYGNDDTLKLGDKNGDKKALVLSFMNDVIGEKNYVDLKLENSGDSIKNVYVYYVLNYCANESTLTWNTMPEYETNLLGVYDINAGTNKIDISAIRDKLTGEYFTLVFRTENHTFYEDFDIYPVDTKIVANKNDNDTKENVDGTEYTHHHAFSEKVYHPENKYIISRQGGNIDTPTIIADTVTNIEGNQILKVTTGASYQYGGRIKFYNSLNDSAITKDSDIVGKTFRFTAKVTVDPQACESTTSNIRVSANAVSSKSNTQLGDNKTTLRYDDLKNGWVTIFVDYTVDKDDIAALSGSYYYYPMFELFFAEGGSTTEFNTYFVDDISVVEVIDDVAVGDAEFASCESGKDISFVSALNDSTTIIETTASSATTGDVISIVDGADTHSVLRAESGKLVFGDTVLCDELGNDIVLTETPIEVVAIYDDINGTVRFAVGDYLAYYKDADGVHATFEHLIIEGGISDSASFGVNGLKASKLKNTTSEIIGFQTHHIDRAVRFLSGVDTTYYNAIGFKLETESKTETRSSTIVYTSVVADDKDVYAKDYGYNLMSAISITDVKSGGVVKVTPFLRVGENYIYGEEVFYKITVEDKVITVVETDENEFGIEKNANLASATIDGKPVVGFSPDVTEYMVPANDPNDFAVEAIAERSEATVIISEQDGNQVSVTVKALDGVHEKVYVFKAYQELSSEVVNKNGADAIVTYVFDDGNKDTATIVTKTLSPKYPSINGSFALITQNLATLSTIEGKEGDGLLEYKFDENGDYVYTKNDTNWEYWETLLNTYGDQGFEAINHTHTHAYIGENDNGGSFTYKSTSGDSFTSDVFPIGNVRKEYYASNQILRELGQRALTLVSAGLTAPDGGMVDYTESYVNLPKTSGAFIGKRITATYPKTPEKMVNSIADFVNEDNRFNIKAYMVQHYNADPSAPSGTSADNYSREACLEAGVGYWTDYIDKAVEMGEWAVFCFHNIKADTYTGTTGHFVYESQADAVFKYSDDLSKENKVWVANFTDACLYAFERSTAEVGAFIDEDGNIVVTLDDKEDDEIFTMPLTVKVELPEGISTASLNGTELVTFEENSKFYTYVDIVPGSTVIISVLSEVYTDISNVPYKALGRTQMLNNALTADWSATGIEFEANCLGKVGVTLTSSASSLFTIVVDGVEYKDVMLSNGNNVIASGLPYGKHTFKIMNQYGYSGKVNIAGVTIRGEFGEKPAESSLLIEFIGDSITHGCGLGSSDYSEGTNDGTLTYAFLAAKELGADYTIMANGGMGVKWGGDYSGANLNRSMAKYPYLNDTGRGTIPYDGYTKDADLVVIGLSTNDNYRFTLQYNAEKTAYTTANPTADEDAIAAHMAEFKATKLAELGAELELLIAEIEKNHGKNVPIILARGMMEKDDELYLTSVTYMTDLIENQWHGMFGEHVIKVAHLTPNRKGYEQHPTREGAVIQGAELADFIKVNFPSLVPQE